MPFKRIKDYLPDIYSDILPEVFDLEIPEESFTQCSDCPLVCESRDELRRDETKPFAPDTKCCTFMPRLPNYLAGAFFCDADPAIDQGRDFLRKAILHRKGIFPHGIWPTKKYRMLYDVGRMDGFGRSRYLKCPYFLDSDYNCSLWKYREAICATWFCKHIAHKTGKELWAAIQEFIQGVQYQLILHCIRELGAPAIEPYGENNNISLEDMDDMPMHPAEYSQRWGLWEGKEEEFYMKCFMLVKKMKRAELAELCGEPADELANRIAAVRNRMMTIPLILARNPDYKMITEHDNVYRIHFENHIERNNTTITYAFDLPAFVLDAFDGKECTDGVLEKINQKHSIRVHPEIIISLYHHGVLMATDNKS